MPTKCSLDYLRRIMAQFSDEEVGSHSDFEFDREVWDTLRLLELNCADIDEAARVMRVLHRWQDDRPSRE